MSQLFIFLKRLGLYIFQNFSTHNYDTLFLQLKSVCCVCAKWVACYKKRERERDTHTHTHNTPTCNCPNCQFLLQLDILATRRENLHFQILMLKNIHKHRSKMLQDRLELNKTAYICIWAKKPESWLLGLKLENSFSCGRLNLLYFCNH